MRTQFPRRSVLVNLSVVAALIAGAAMVTNVTAQSAAAAPIPPYLNLDADGLTITNTGGRAVLHAWASCGGEFAGAVPDARSLATATTLAPPVPISYMNRYYGPGTCNGSQPVGRNVVIRNGDAYWIARAGYIGVRATWSSPTEPPQRTYDMIRRPPLLGDAHEPSLVVDDNAITWTEYDSVHDGGWIYDYRAPEPGAPYANTRRASFKSPGYLTNLVGGIGGSRFVIANEGGTQTLLGLRLQEDGTYAEIDLSLTDHVSAVTTDAGAVYWAERMADGYDVLTRSMYFGPLDQAVHFGPARRLRHITDKPAGTRVGIIAVDPTTSVTPNNHDVWWSVIETGRPSDPEILHLDRSANSLHPVALESEVSNVFDLATDGSYIYWTDTNAVYRVLNVATPPHAVTDPLTTQDVSPDLPYRHGVSLDNYSFGADPGGRITDILVDPAAPNTLLAASQYAGPWRSTDGGQNWRQSSQGMTTGVTDDGAVMAIDPANHQRVLYVTADEGRTFNATPGDRVWWSENNGVSWNAISTAQLPCHVVAVAFANGRAYASGIDCGIFTSTDLSSWTMVNTANTPPSRAFLIGSGKSLFACLGQDLFWTSNDAATWTKRQLAAGTGCRGSFPIGVVPNGTATPDTIVVTESTSNGGAIARQVNMATGVNSSLGFPNFPLNASGNVVVSGGMGVWVARTASGGYHVYGATGEHFFRWTGGTSWARLAGIHWDSRALAFSPFYDPANGNCKMYVATDGSVAVNATTPGVGHPCTPSEGPFQRAQHGLHAYKSSVVNGVHRQVCFRIFSAPITPCPVLYVSSGDNGLWVRDQLANPQWDNMRDCCGDNGGVLIDPAKTNRLISTRNGYLQEYQSGGGFVSAGSDTVGVNKAPPNYADPDWPASPSGASTVLVQGVTLPNGDDIAVRQIPEPNDPNPNAPTTGTDRVVRSRDNRTGGWMNIGFAFEWKAVKQVATSGGSGANLQIWVRDNNGQILRGRVDSAGNIGSWTSLTPTTMNVSIFWANPYNRDEAWAVETMNQQIVRSSAGPGATLTWTPVPDLTAFATGSDPRIGSQQWRFGRIESHEIPFAPLNHMWFPPSNSNPMRVATLGPAGVAVSHDRGATWIPLREALPFDRWLAYPWSTWLDQAPTFGSTNSDLYLALLGRGLQRVSGPFETLGDVAYDYCPTGVCPALMGLNPSAALAPTSVRVVDELTGGSFALTESTDGHWRGHQLIDIAGRGRIRYHFVVDKVAGPTITHTLTASERKHGRILGAKFTSTPSTLPQVGPVKLSQPVAYSTVCDDTPQSLDANVVVTVPGGGTPDAVELRVSTLTTDEVGDRHFTHLDPLPMSSSDGVEWSVTFDPADLTDGALKGESLDGDINPFLVLQPEAFTKDGAALGTPNPVPFADCLTGIKLPGPPTITAVKPVRGGAEVTWTKPASNGGARVLGYVIVPRTGGADVRSRYYGTSARRGLVVGLKTGAKYTFVVRAINARGTGGASNRSAAVVPR